MGRVFLLGLNSNIAAHPTWGLVTTWALNLSFQLAEISSDHNSGFKFPIFFLVSFDSLPKVFHAAFLGVCNTQGYVSSPSCRNLSTFFSFFSSYYFTTSLWVSLTSQYFLPFLFLFVFLHLTPVSFLLWRYIWSHRVPYEMTTWKDK